MTQRKINLALLLGDPSGIGPELVSKLLNEDITNKVNLIIIGEKKIFENGNKITNLEHSINFVREDLSNIDPVGLAGDATNTPFKLFFSISSEVG